MKRGWQWPVLVSLALAFTVGVNVVMLFAPSADPNGTVVEPDYYRKAVEWDRTMARRAASDALGWQAHASWTATADGPQLRIELRGADGSAVEGAEVSATLIHNLAASTPLDVSLAAQDAGVYTAQPTLPHAGMWEVRVAARRGDARFATSLRAEAP
jgi:nitrogen fixation protein FixH